jgi:hypothetical protein
MSIENAFEYELEQNYDNREDVIALGTEYGFTGPDYADYSKGYNALLICKNSLSATSSGRVSGAFSSDSVTAIKRFKKLYADLKSSVGTAMNEDIRSEMDFKSFLDKYEIICRAVADTTLSLTCSNYVNGEVVHLLNNDNMKLREGVGYMVRIYNIAPTNFQVKNNLEGILSNLVTLIEEKGYSADRNALNKALADTGNTFTTIVADATIQAKLSILVDKVNSGAISKSSALSDVYGFYQKSPNNDRVCENLATLCEMCIFEYIINDSYGTSSVKTTLNNIARNMSPTFTQKARKLGKTFNEMWSKIPYDTKNLMCGGLDLNSSLNSKGEALKLGLQYLKKLGSVSQSSDDSLLGIRGVNSRLHSLFRTELPDLPL